jgi:hypothetical protein
MAWRSPSAPEIATSIEQFFKNWLQGSTCGNQKLSIAWQSECGNYVLLKHPGHTAYVDRVTKSVNCCTCYYLYDIRLPYPDVLGKPWLGKWEGRWTKAKQKELEELIK